MVTDASLSGWGAVKPQDGAGNLGLATTATPHKRAGVV